MVAPVDMRIYNMLACWWLFSNSYIHSLVKKRFNIVVVLDVRYKVIVNIFNSLWNSRIDLVGGFPSKRHQCSYVAGSNMI